MEPIAASARRIGGIVLRLQSDERLAQLASAGSDDAFELLVRRYRAGLVRACRRILPEDGAEDAVQQALLDAHRALTRNGSPDRFQPWLNRIAVNAALKQRDEGGDTVPLSEEVNGVAGAAAIHERQQRFRSMLGAIDRLPHRQRAPEKLHQVQGRERDAHPFRDTEDPETPDPVSPHRGRRTVGGPAAPEELRGKGVVEEVETDRRPAPVFPVERVQRPPVPPEVPRRPVAVPRPHVDLPVTHSVRELVQHTLRALAGPRRFRRRA